MGSERLQWLDEIFHGALELPPGRRAAFLDEACANDSGLRTEIETLISADEQSGDFIEGSAADVAALLLRDVVPHDPAERVRSIKQTGRHGTRQVRRDGVRREPEPVVDLMRQHHQRAEFGDGHEVAYVVVGRSSRFRPPRHRRARTPAADR